MKNKESDLIGNILIISLLSLLLIAGYISYKSIDWDVLERLESQKLITNPVPTIPVK
jgi:hypothetical protein